MASFIGGQVARSIHDHFQDLQSKRRFDPCDLASGRAYVASYVSFIHYVEGLDSAARRAAESHYPDAPGTQADSHKGTPALS